jgi:hypothetical protein
MKLREMWGRLVGANYRRALESDVARLRMENRALLNSILGIAGVPPIVVAADDAAATSAKLGTETTASSHGAIHERNRGAASAAAIENASALSASRVRQRVAAKPGVKRVATPMRRRSWHQIYRMLEIDAARKKETV